MEIIVAITGATGSIFGIRMLEVLQEISDVKTHLILSDWGRRNIVEETEYTVAEVEALADYQYATDNLGARISSGSYPVDAMIVAPCSMKTLAAFFYGLAYGFLTTTLQAIAIGELPKSKQGTANAMYLSFMDLGMALGSSILGLVAGALGYRAIYGVSLVSLVVLLLIYTPAYGRKSGIPHAKEA